MLPTNPPTYVGGSPNNRQTTAEQMPGLMHRLETQLNFSESKRPILPDNFNCVEML
ncbi:MAG: hypothetical protein ACRCUY_03505 [Thermoguttaceae bacterium]